MGLFDWMGKQPTTNLSKRDQKLQAAMPEKEFQKYIRNKQKQHKRSTSTASKMQTSREHELKRYLEQCRTSYHSVQQNMGFETKGSRPVTCNATPSLVWQKNGKLYLIEQYPSQIVLEQNFRNGESVPKWKSHIIPLSSIQRLSIDGDIYTETTVSGGGTNGSRIADAIVGAAIAGVPGAIIASQPRVDPIKTTTVRKDDRKTVLMYSGRSLEFAYKDYMVLKNLLEHSTNNHRQQPQNENQNTVDALRNLKLMLDEGLITQAEYDSKKTEILSRM